MASIAENEIVFDDNDDFWVIEDHHWWGPFNYQWSADLYGIQFTYQGLKFGEVCGDAEFFADLEPHGLPISTARVATIVMGCLAEGLRGGQNAAARRIRLIHLLNQFGLAHFTPRTT